MTRTPMPSPNNTNRAGLYLEPGTRAAVTYDAAPDDGDETDYAALLAFLETKLEDGDLAKVRRMLGLDNPDLSGAGAEDRRRVGASDAARRNAYAADAYSLHRRGHINDRELERRIQNGPPHQMTAAEEAAFAARFPHAARLKY